MKNIKLYPDIQTAIGSVEETDFIASVYDVDDVLKASEKEYGQYKPEPEPEPIPEWYGASINTDWTQRYMEIVPLDNGTVDLGYFDYSFDGINWTNVRSPRAIQVSKYQVLYIKTNLSYYSIGNFTFDFYVRGNLGLSFTGIKNFFDFF